MQTELQDIPMTSLRRSAAPGATLGGGAAAAAARPGSGGGHAGGSNGLPGTSDGGLGRSTNACMSTAALLELGRVDHTSLQQGRQDSVGWVPLSPVQ